MRLLTVLGNDNTREDDSMSQHSTAARGGPDWGRPSQSKEKCGMPRSKLYEIAAAHKGIIKKLGAASYVNYARVNQIIAALPDADIATKPTGGKTTKR
jgi:hypothetical protein